MESQHADLDATVVMRRFFRALNEENLLAAELWAGHDHFDGGSIDYANKFDRWVRDKINTSELPMDVLEWLLTYTKGTTRNFFRRGSEYRTRNRGNNWRGVVCDLVREWMRNPRDLSETQKRIARLLYELTWLTPDYELMDSKEGRDWLLKIATPAKLMKMALVVRSGWDTAKSKHVTHPICMPLIETLLAKGPVDLSLCGSELLTQYKKDEGRAIALKLIAQRDTSIPMPTQFTDFIQNVVEQYKWYQRVREDLPTLLGAKTHESD
jgi:hypothetical protein